VIRAGTWLPSLRRSDDATTRFGDPRFCLVYFCKERAAGSRCFAIGSLRIRSAHLQRLPGAAPIDVTVIGLLRIHCDVQPSLADAKLGVVRAFPLLRAKAGVTRVVRAHPRPPAP
jgi:hypothetical protein